MTTISKVILTRFNTDKELRKKEGEFFDDAEYKEIDFDCDCYDGNAEFVCSIRKNVIPKDTITDYKPIFFDKNDNRGMSGGKINMDNLLGYKNITKDNIRVINDYKYIRIKKDGTETKFRLSNPVRSNIIGYFDYINHKTINGKKTNVRKIGITSHTNEISLNTLEPLTRIVDKYYKEIQPDKYWETKRELTEKGFKEFIYKDTLFTTITINTDFRTGLHKDKNNYNYIGCMAVMNDGDEQFTGGELLLPAFRVRCKLSAGDLIVFNSNTYHTNNSIIGGCRYSFVYYLRTNIAKFYDKENTRVVRGYTEDIFINYKEPAILLIDKYNKIKDDIIDYAIEFNLLIYRLSKKTSFKRRNFGKGQFRYIQHSNKDKFTNPVFIDTIKEYWKVKRLVIKPNELIKTKKVCSLKRQLEFWVRPDTTDRKAIQEVVENRDYQNKNINFDFDENDVWLDLGLNIGAFTCLAMEYGVKKVISYEPEPENFKMAMKNVFMRKSKTEVILKRKAIGLNNDKIKLYLCNTDYNKYRHTTMPTENRKHIYIDCESIYFALSENPDINAIKIDIEGREIELLDNVDLWINPNIKKLTLEYSFDYDDLIHNFHLRMDSLRRFFKIVKHKKMSDKKRYDNYPQTAMVYCINS